VTAQHTHEVVRVDALRQRERREAQVDYVIIGSGAGGATAARVLAEAGRSLLILEEGPELATAERPRAVVDAMRMSFRDGGSMATQSRTPVPILQGRLVGGSTAINSGIIWRMPEDVQELWKREHGLGELIEPRALSATFEQIERELSIADTPLEVQGRNAQLMAQAADALKLPGRTIARNVKGCVGSARCLQGCPGGARQSMDVSYVPYAVARGALLWPLARADEIEVKAGRARGVRGRLLDPSTRKPMGVFRAVAKRGVILAAGALNTPLLLWKIGLRGLVGERFQAHPGAAVAGRFADPVVQGFGATQAYEVPMRAQGYKLETLSIPPELLAARLPGVGASWQQRLAELGHYAHWVTQVRMRALGRVRPSLFGKPVLHYEPRPEDMLRLRESIALLVRMFFAAGAVEVSHGLYGLPPLFTSASQAALIEQLPLTLAHVHLLASHLFGTACAGSDPARSVVAPNLACHAIENLYVMDASVFPTNMGVNPQHSIMALAWRAAAQLT
jgi:choline dehydrogenase-like flavoprotein